MSNLLQPINRSEIEIIVNFVLWISNVQFSLNVMSIILSEKFNSHQEVVLQITLTHALAIYYNIRLNVFNPSKR